MFGFLISSVLILAAAWGWLVLQNTELQGRFPLVSSLVVQTIAACLAATTDPVVVMWFAYGTFLMTTNTLARHGVDPNAVASEDSPPLPPNLWQRSQAVAWVSLGCVTLGLVVLVALSGKWQFPAMATELSAILRPTHSGTASFWQHASARLAVVAILVGSSLATFTAPGHLVALEAVHQWPGAVAGWWLMTSRALGLALVCRVAQSASVGLESTFATVAIALGLLSLLQGVSSLWQPHSLRDLVARLLLIQTGLSWIALAAYVVSPSGDSSQATTALPLAGPALMAAIWCCSSLASLVSVAIEQSLGRQHEPVEFFDQLQGLKQHRPLAAVCLVVGVLSLTVLPPTPMFWTFIASLLAAITPGQAVFDHAGLMPHPAVVLGIAVAGIALLAATVRVVSLISPVILNESLGTQSFLNQPRVMAVAILGSVTLVLAGLLPGLWMAQ